MEAGGEPNELRRLNAELEKRVSSARRNSRLFNYSVAHDLRAPLRVMNRICHRRDGRPRPRARRRRQASNSPASSMATLHAWALIDALLAFGASRRQTPRHEQVGIADVTATIIEELRRIGRNAQSS